ncbi:MAG: ribulose 1,5-bisphosphate carboxylase [bacterium]|nr:ribulose 1,5-bisphosphate carboxylase [bacterium]
MIDLDYFLLQESPHIEDYVIGTYLCREEIKNSKEILKISIKMASEQTIGTWTQVPGETKDMFERHHGKVLNIWEIPDREQFYSDLNEPCTYVIQIAFPWENFGPQIPMMLTTVFGNISMIGDIKLLDIQLPRKFVEKFPGPQFGVSGIRNLLGVPERPLLNTMIKPSTGITPDQGAEILYQAAIGGADIIKDDEVMGDTELSPLLKRVELYMDKLRKAEKKTGEKKLYAVNVTDEPAECIKKAEVAINNGVNAIMVNFLPAGMGLIASLARNPKINVPILAHHDFGGALYASPWHGISSSLLYGKLARIIGVDLLVIPTPYGKFSLNYSKYLRIASGLRSILHDKRRVWPIVGGAIKQGHVAKLLSDLGRDFVIGAGGAIHAHPMGSKAGAKAFRQGIDQIIEYGKLDEAKMGKELKAAIDLWGEAYTK